MPNVLSPRDLVFRPDYMDETVLSSIGKYVSLLNSKHIVTTYDFVEKLPFFIVLIPTPDFPRFYYMLGANLG